MTVEARVEWDKEYNGWVVTQVDEVQLVKNEIIHFPDEYGWVREEQDDQKS